MTTTELIEYLEMTVDMEKNMFIQESVISQIKDKMNHLGIPKTYTEPQIPLRLQKLGESSGESFTIKDIFMELIPIVVFNLGAVSIIVALYFVLGVPRIIAYILLFFVELAVIQFIIESISNLQQKKKESAERSKLTHKYESEKAEYDWQISTDRNRVAAENVIKAELESKLKQLSDQNKVSRQTLLAIYDVGIIYPKYRNFIMQCSILEYLNSGRCTTLEGADGAYNTLEVEMRLDKIIMKLDQIVAKLDSIKENQYILYSAVKEGNQTASQILTGINQIASSLDDINVARANAQSLIEEKLNTIAANSTVTAYNNQRIQQEIYYMNRVNYYSGRNDDAGVYHRVPPTP